MITEIVLVLHSEKYQGNGYCIGNEGESIENQIDGAFTVWKID